MTIHEILEQIDAYLLLLYQAREILSNPGRANSATRNTRCKKSTRKSRIQSSTSVSISDLPQSSVRDQPAREKRAVLRSNTLPLVDLPNSNGTVSPTENVAAGEIVKRVPERRGTSSKRVALHRRAKPIDQDALKSKTPLSHPVRSKVVVISAEQLRLERERSAKPLVARPRSPGSVATGRLAFEALFSR